MIWTVPLFKFLFNPFCLFLCFFNIYVLCSLSWLDWFHFWQGPFSAPVLLSESMAFHKVNNFAYYFYLAFLSLLYFYFIYKPVSLHCILGIVEACKVDRLFWHCLFRGVLSTFLYNRFFLVDNISKWYTLYKQKSLSFTLEYYLWRITLNITKIYTNRIIPRLLQ